MSHTRVEELLHYFALGRRQALVQVAHAVGQSLSQSRVINFLQERCQVFLSAMQEPKHRVRLLDDVTRVSLI